jgi:hypothetical protein
MALLALAGGVAAKEKRASKEGPARRLDGRPLLFMGNGLRASDEGEKLYELSLWVDEQDARRAFPALVMRAGGRSKSQLVDSDHTPEFLVYGRFAKVAVLRFMRAFTAAQLRSEIGDALDEKLPGREELLAQLAGVSAGDELTITSRGNDELELLMADDPKGKPLRAGPASPKLVRALWEVWLGPKPAWPTLRRALVEHIDLLGR